MSWSLCKYSCPIAQAPRLLQRFGMIPEASNSKVVDSQRWRVPAIPISLSHRNLPSILRTSTRQELLLSCDSWNCHKLPLLHTFIYLEKKQLPRAGKRPMDQAVGVSRAHASVTQVKGEVGELSKTLLSSKNSFHVIYINGVAHRREVKGVPVPPNPLLPPATTADKCAVEGSGQKLIPEFREERLSPAVSSPQQSAMYEGVDIPQGGQCISSSSAPAGSLQSSSTRWLKRVKPVELRPPTDMEDARSIMDVTRGGALPPGSSGFQVRDSFGMGMVLLRCSQSHSTPMDPGLPRNLSLQAGSGSAAVSPCDPKPAAGLAFFYVVRIRPGEAS